MAPLVRIGSCVVLVALTIIVTPVLAAAPSIRAADGRLQAHVMPAEGWCAPVVDVELRAKPHVFTQSPEEVQRFIGAVRAGIIADCPSAEIVRIRGIEQRDAKFVAYTAKSEDWRIRVLPFGDRVLPMLAFKDAPPALSRKLAYFETRRLFDRAKLPEVIFDRSNTAEESDHLDWSIDELRGATYVLTDRRRTHRSLGEFADAAARVYVDRCADDRDTTIENAAADSPAPNVQVRTFECNKNGQGVAFGIVSAEDQDLTVVLVFESEYRSLVRALSGFLTEDVGSLRDP